MNTAGTNFEQDTKRPKTQLLLLRCPEQNQGTAVWSLHTAKPRGWADHPSHPSSPNLGPIATLIPFREPVGPCSGSKQGNLLLVFAPCSSSPSKALLECLVWPLTNFYWLRRPRTLVGNKNILCALPSKWQHRVSWVQGPDLAEPWKEKGDRPNFGGKKWQIFK